MRDEAEVNLCVAVIKQAIVDLEIEEVKFNKKGEVVSVFKHWRGAVRFLTGGDMDTWLRAANIDGEELKRELKEEGILGSVSLGLGAVGLVKINRAQGYGWLYAS